jgi:ABC-type transport system substrate-binding protein
LFSLKLLLAEAYIKPTVEFIRRILYVHYLLAFSGQARSMDVSNPNQLANYFATDGYSNWSKYSNAEIDSILADLDHIIDPNQRRETLWQIDRTLLTDLPALPTGLFPPNFMRTIHGLRI